MTASEYLSHLPFSADRFQFDAADAIDRGESVVVTAPTGSGKTVVAEAAVHRALTRSERAIYTTPIKALSNQKFGEFRDRYGEADVGLLTGDNSINPSASVVVMTTEVLRNMMYASSSDLEDVGVVVLDEVHYLQDRTRGAVWEEIIIHLDHSIPLVCLSATVANGEEFVGWIRERRGRTSLVAENERPVPLEVTYLMRDRFSGHELRLFPAFSGSRPNERLATLLRRDRGRRRRYAPPRRFETCAYLQQRGLLPAIFFIFSRKGCERAARMVVDRGLRLTTRSEADQIEEMAMRATSHVNPVDLEVLGFGSLLELMKRGVAPHHAGMVPALKEAVEAMFAAGLIKVVFATETLALGINMPARTVVLESLTKFNGESHETLQPGDFTQLTGRAGRRGIDVEGTAVVLHSEYLEFERVAGIAARGSHPLRSSFRPNYNMAVNLVAHYDLATAERLLTASFAEFDRNRQQDSLLAEIEADEARLSALRAEAEHPDVDVFEVLDGDGRNHGAVMAQFVSASPPGTVLEWEERGKRRRVVVIAVGKGKQPRVLTVTEDGGDRRLASGKMPASVRSVGTITLPKPFRPRDAAYRAQVAERLAGFDPTNPPRTAYEIDAAPGQDLGPHLEAARSARRLEGRIASRRRQMAAAGPAIVRRFRAITQVLNRFGYLTDWRLTDKGTRLRTIYNELDLLLVESFEADVWTGLNAAETAGLASAFTYRPRHSDGPDRWPPELSHPGALLDARWEELVAAERSAGVSETRQPDPGFAYSIMAWVSGATLRDLFEDGDPAVGDFVRSARQLIDLLRQIDDTEAVEGTPVREALRAIDRGVVAAAGSV